MTLTTHVNKQYLVIVGHHDSPPADFSLATRKVFTDFDAAESYKNDMLRHGHKSAHVVHAPFELKDNIYG